MALAGAPTLLKKEFREHGLSMLLLSGGFIITLLLAHAQNQQAAFTMSPLQVLLLSITLVIPLIAFIMGNRLIATEYLGHTRQFVESLPIKPLVFLIIKYLLGLFFVSGLALAAIAYACLLSDSGDALDQGLLNIVLVKVLCVVFFIWSVVFCFSFFGFLRFALYVMLGVVMVTLISYPGFDQREFGPFALLDQTVFAFERDQMPIKAVMQTLLMGVVFTLGGFLLPLMRDGSLIESLAKPVNRSNMVVLAVIGVGILATLGSLFEKWDAPEYNFSSDHVVSVVDPPVSILYLEPEYEGQSQQLLESMRVLIMPLQQTLNLEVLPTVRIALDKGLSETDLNDIRFGAADGVLVRANYLQYDSFSMAVLQTNAVHQLIQATSGNRRTFEPYHWLIDGFTRWWVEENLDEEAHRTELLTRALHSLDYLEEPIDLANNWQWIAEAVSYPSAEALAYTALVFFEQRFGRDAVLELANIVLVPNVSEDVFGMVKDRSVGIQSPFSEIAGQDLDSFFTDWQQWLLSQQSEPAIASLLSRLPRVKGIANSETSVNGVHELTGRYQAMDSLAQVQFAGFMCDMQHVLISPFDYEIAWTSGEHETQACDSSDALHSASSYYASGDRVFVAFEVQLDALHQALRVGAYRLVVE
ncbi:MAG: hypothetical protein V3U65_19285 [Granulosicoccaceae bacterium]